jgi:hypothetical protein
VLGVAVRENLGLPDAGIENTATTRARARAGAATLRPRGRDRALPRPAPPDHRVASELIRDACFLAGS